MHPSGDDQTRCSRKIKEEKLSSISVLGHVQVQEYNMLINRSVEPGSRMYRFIHLLVSGIDKLSGRSGSATLTSLNLSGADLTARDVLCLRRGVRILLHAGTSDPG